MSAEDYFDRGDAYFELIGMGIKYSELGEYTKAIEYLQKALEINPEFDPPWVLKGLAHFELGEYNKAIDCLEKAVKINPEHADAWEVMGNAYGMLGERMF